MNLIEAIKSRRPLRRARYKECSSWITPDVGHHLALLSEDILAEDWEIQESTVTITRAQFWEAAREAVPQLNLDGVMCSSELCELARKLGLGDP